MKPLGKDFISPNREDNMQSYNYHIPGNLMIELKKKIDILNKVGFIFIIINLTL